jgi:hypothetical protein
MAANSLFTMNLVLALGGEENDQTQTMVRTLNSLVYFWGRDAQLVMEQFINLVKSRTDILAVMLEPGSKKYTPVNASEDKGIAPESKEGVSRTHSEEIKKLVPENIKLEGKLKECEAKLSTAQKEMQEQQAKYTKLLDQRVSTSQAEGKLKSIVTSYIAKCKELTRLQFESGRYSM